MQLNSESVIIKTEQIRFCHVETYAGFFLAVLHGMWDLSSLTGDQTCAPALEAWNLKYWTTREVPRNIQF